MLQSISWRTAVVAAGAVALVTACGDSATPARIHAAASVIGVAAAPVFTGGACPFTLPKGLVAGRDVECGTVPVPLHRATPAGSAPGTATPAASAPAASAPGTAAPAPAELATLILRAGPVRTGNAVFHMIGGPGGSAEAFASVLPKFAALARSTGRDVVLVDQRGTGHSRPYLDCDAEFAAAQTSGKDPVPACKARLKAAGIDPSDFTPAAIVDDIDDVRRALSYRTIDVWGQSGGSYLAQEFARRHPAAVRSLMIESVDSGPTSLGKPSGFNAALDRMISACARQKACSQRNPALDQQLSQTFAGLNARPLSTKYGAINGSAFIAVIEQSLEYATGTVVTADFITAAHRRDAATVTKVLTQLSAGPQITGPFSAVMNQLVNCAQTQQYASAQSIAAANVGIRPEIRATGVPEVLSQYVTICASWGVTFPADAAGVPVPNAIPTLVMNGDVDPNTALDYARTVASYARTVQAVSFAGYGHLIAAGGDTCGLSVYASFLKAPDKPVNQRCVPIAVTFRAPAA